MQDDWLGLLVAVVSGAVGGGAAWFLLRPVFGTAVLARRNFRDRDVPVAGGLVLVLAALAVFAAAVVVEVAVRSGGDLRPVAGSSVSSLVVVLGFGLLGFVDDAVGSGSERGFKGHLSALRRGTLSAGGLKLAGGGAVALAAVYFTGPRTAWDLLRDAALIALAANLGNLLDLAPGRAIKSSVIAFVVLVTVSGANQSLRGAAVLVGAALAVLWPDLREKVMMGDTGANPLGAVLGLGVVLVGAPSTRTGVVIVLLLMNLASEFVSFSRVIAKVPPLRMLDEVGRIR